MMHSCVRAGVALVFACVGLVSCAGGRTSTVPVTPAPLGHDGLIVTLHGARMTYDADSSVTAARGLLFIRSTSRAAALELAEVQQLTRTKNGVSVDIALGTLAVEERFFRRAPRTTQGCPIAPQVGAPRPFTDCNSLPPDADLFEKMEYATGPGDIIPGRAHGGLANCPDFFQIGSWWRVVNFDIFTGDGDPNGTCVNLTGGGGSGGGSLGPTLQGSATDYRYNNVEGLVALDMGLPGVKTSTRSYIMRYRGQGIPFDGGVGSFGVGQTSATIEYLLGFNGPSGQFSTMQVDVYQGPVALLGPYLGFGRGINPRFALF
jgi:hypothetical protein